MIVHIKAAPSVVEYPIYFTSEVFAPENRHLSNAIRRRDPASRHRIAVVVDRGVIVASREMILHIERYAAHHHAYLDLVAPPIVLDGGETLKDDALLLSRLQSYFHALELDRRSVLLVVGGASLLDLAGFASATMRSAPRVIRLPTTTLAQAGPAVLPASSINAFGTKDFLGTPRERDAIVGTFERLGLRLWHDALGRADSEGRPLLLDGLAELCGGRAPRVPLLVKIGGGVVGHALRESVVREAIEWLAGRDAYRAHAWALA